MSELIEMLKKAREIGASDLHVCTDRPLFLRLNGSLRFASNPLKPEDTERILLESLEEKQREDLKNSLGLEACLVDEEGKRYRACYIRHRRGWDGSFRIISERIPALEELGLPPQLERLTEHHQGLVLVGGPGGAGKTTTLAALLDLINKTRRDHIITIEDPIEYVITPELCQITQRQIGPHTLSFANSLKAALREDPDIIMVGEMRDLETMSMVITAAETGHLVLSTVHTISATRTIGAIIDAFPPEQQEQVRIMLAESLRGIICQQLVPSPSGTSMYPALEVLLGSAGVANIIRDNKTEMLASEIQTGTARGMRLMDNSLAKLVEKKKISLKEARSRAQDKERFSS